jgi:hypothetical protein
MLMSSVADNGVPYLQASLFMDVPAASMVVRRAPPPAGLPGTPPGLARNVANLGIAVGG